VRANRAIFSPRSTIFSLTQKKLNKKGKEKTDRKQKCAIFSFMHPLSHKSKMKMKMERRRMKQRNKKQMISAKRRKKC
jgi:hypothetical protein